MRRIWLCLVTGLGVALTGCGDDGGRTGGDGGVTDTGMMSDTGGSVSLMIAGGAADYSCNTTRAAPAGGEDVTFTLQVEDFAEDTPVEGACVEFYADNLIPASTTCAGETTDANGHISVTAPAGGWYAYRVFGDSADPPAFIDAVQINEPAAATAGETITATSISSATANQIPLLLAARRAAGTAFIAGTIYDCSADGDDPAAVSGATVRVARLDGTYITAGPGLTDTKYAYFDGANNLPDVNQEYSNTDGLYLALNLPIDAAGEELLIEIWGSIDGGEAEVVGCEQARVFPDSGALVNVGPVRAGGPSCPGLN